MYLCKNFSVQLRLVNTVKRLRTIRPIINVARRNRLTFIYALSLSLLYYYFYCAAWNADAV